MLKTKENISLSVTSPLYKESTLPTQTYKLPPRFFLKNCSMDSLSSLMRLLFNNPASSQTFSRKKSAFRSMSASVISTSSSSESDTCSGPGRLSTDSTYSVGSKSVSEGEVTEGESQRIGDC